MVLRVLAVEDDEFLVVRWRRACEDAGVLLHAVATLSQARRVLEQWHAASYDYVLLDLRLPDGSGSSILEALLALEPHPKLAVVSGYLDAELMLSLQTQAIWMLAKPVTPAQVIALLDRMQGDGMERRPRDTPGAWRFTEAHHLSSCETEAFLYLVEGLSREDVARRMGCQLSTVHTYVKRIREKTHQSTFRGVLAALVSYLELHDAAVTSSGKDSSGAHHSRGA
jgi:DNA-binding NarL/FixJ family response regulator